jgi:hypothetical protein
MIRGKKPWVPPCTPSGGPCNDKCTENKCKSTICPYKNIPRINFKRECKLNCEDCKKETV